MDFLKVSNKTTTPCTGDSLFALNPQQYKEIYSPTHPHFITPYGGNGVLGCYYYYPFTNSQLKELERQAMIYKYMIASIPVPFDLLVSTSSASSPYSNKQVAGDLEPGRCRRTDGKKWRCSKEVVFNYKYCERHLHRGRPRSKKHVEPPYSRPINNDASEKTKLETLEVSSTLSKFRGSSGSEMLSESATTKQENKYLNFIDIWSDGVRSSENQSNTSTSVSLNNGNLSLYSMGHSDIGLVQMGVTSLEERSLAPMSATPGGPLAEILRPNANFACYDDEELCIAMPGQSQTRGVKKPTGSVSNESSQI